MPAIAAPSSPPIKTPKSSQPSSSTWRPQLTQSPEEKRKAKLDAVDLVFLLGFAVLADFLDFIDLAGLGFIGFIPYFYLKGVMDQYLWMMAGILAIGSVAFVPPNIAFVIIAYVHEKKKAGSKIAGVAEFAIQTAATGGSGSAASGGAMDAETAALNAKSDAIKKELAESKAKSSARTAETDRVAKGIAPDGGSQQQERAGAEGTPLAGGSPLAGGEGNSDEKSEGSRSGAQSTPDQVSKEEAQQQAAASGQSPNQPRAPESALAQGSPLETETSPIAQPPSEEKKKPALPPGIRSEGKGPSAGQAANEQRQAKEDARKREMQREA